MFASQKRSKWSHLQILSSETRVNCVQWRRWRRADFLLGKTWPVVRVRETLRRRLFQNSQNFPKMFKKHLDLTYSPNFPKVSRNVQKHLDLIYFAPWAPLVCGFFLNCEPEPRPHAFVPGAPAIFFQNIFGIFLCQSRLEYFSLQSSQYQD